MAHALDWFEIPTTDLDRAIRFYETVLAVALKREVFGGVQMANFPFADKSTGGALVQDTRRKPSGDGALLYLNARGQLDACVQRIAKAGGVVISSKVDIGEPGFIAIFRDTEGNVVGLHQER
jgi:predicted enzyme related to lactoylglutathione lyase